VNLLKDYFNYEGTIFYDLNKPEGQKKRILDNSEMQKIHNIRFTSIKDGIFKTSKWFEKNYHKKNGIRL
jgi:nucleoside-diphosphate-sugar epimerase